MSCRGCPGSQEQVSDVQRDMAKAYALQQKRKKYRDKLALRVNNCLRCEYWNGHWKCDKLPDEKVFRKAIRSGRCPEGVFKDAQPARGKVRRGNR